MASAQRPRGRTDLLTGEPVAGRTERADAARNRRKILAAAEALFARQDPRSVTMDEIARAAGVGRATLYRRYAGPAAIATALLDEHERQVQEEILHGEPPLGPGAPAVERMIAFYDAMVDILDRHLPLSLGAETGSRRFATGAYGFWRVHVAALISDAALSPADGLVDVLLAPLAPELFDYLRQRGLAVGDIAESLHALARGVFRPA